MSSSPTLKTVVIKPGEKIIIPSGARVTSVITDGVIDVTSTCNNLPTPTGYVCGYFYLIMDVDSNDGHSMDEKHTFINTVKVGSTTYTVGRRVIYVGDNPGQLITPEILNPHIPDGAIFKFTFSQRVILDKRQGIYLFFKAPETLFNTIEMETSNFGSISYFKPYRTECDVYDTGN